MNYVCVSMSLSLCSSSNCVNHCIHVFNMGGCIYVNLVLYCGETDSNERRAFQKSGSTQITTSNNHHSHTSFLSNHLHPFSLSPFLLSPLYLILSLSLHSRYVISGRVDLFHNWWIPDRGDQKNRMPGSLQCSTGRYSVWQTSSGVSR
jgi:hypothetical protein